MSTRLDLPPAEKSRVGEVYFCECHGGGDSHMASCRVVKVHHDGLHAEVQCPDPSHPPFTVELDS